MNCPYCSSTNTAVFLEMKTPNFLAAYEKKHANLIKPFPFEASLCLDCLLGFNSKPLPNEELDLIYDNYKYINPNRGIGTTKYEGMKRLLRKALGPSEYIVDIGCSDGYLLSYLYDHGYRNLEGIDPSPVPLSPGYNIKMRREYFGENTRFDKKVDSFLLIHVWEHFPTPLRVLEMMRSHLDAEGEVVMEFPNFSGFCHQHLLYYNKYFLRRLCIDQDISIEHYEEERDAIRLIMKFGEKKTTPDFHKSEKEAFRQSVFKIRDKSQTAKKSLISFIQSRQNSPIIWWGSGSVSVIALSQIPEEILRTANITVVDSDTTRKGLFLPGFQGQIQYADETLRGSHIETLVIATSFRKEILEKIASLGCTVGSEYQIEYI